MRACRIPARNIAGVARFGEELLHAFSKQRMNKSRGDLGHRNKNELTQMEPRMRQCQKRRVHCFAAEKKEVEVNDARLFFVFVAPAENVFDPEKASHHLCRTNVADMYRSDHIQEVELAFEANRLGFIDIGKAVNGEVGLDQTANRREQIAGAVAKVGTHANIGCDEIGAHKGTATKEIGEYRLFVN